MKDGSSNKQYSLGVDIGGTFTDVVVYENQTGRVHSLKELTTPNEPYKGALAGIRRLFEREGLAYGDVSRIIHATTLFTNALIEKKGAPTGLITTRGFRDTLEMSREHKYELFDLHIHIPKPLVPRKHRKEITERMDPSGEVITPLDEAGLLQAAAELVADGVQSIAIVFLHAYANGAHEQQARDLIQAKFPDLFISISSDISPQVREYERCSTTVANAYIKPLAEGYLDKMAQHIADIGITAPLFLMLSNGGLTHIQEAKRVPIQLLESGPAAGALVGSYFSGAVGIPNVLAFDMGGTTAKLAIIEDGQPVISYQFEASREKRFAPGSGMPLSISTVELIEIGAGGGSIASIDALGLLKVGPESASSLPGPACYGKGGEYGTVTDANFVLGFLDPAQFAGGSIHIDLTLAEKALQPLADGTRTSLPELAWGIYSVVNENMASAARVHAAERGCSASEFALLLTGGGGPLHGCEVARRLGITTVICPPSAGVASALGLLIAPARIDRARTVSWRLGSLSWDEMEAAYQALEADARAVIEQTLPGKGQQARILRAADLRFVGQGFEVVTDLPAGPYDASSKAPITEAFTTAYRRTFGHLPPVGDVEVINIRIAAVYVDEDVSPATEFSVGGEQAIVDRRNVWQAGQKAYATVPVYARHLLTSGQVIAGPAVVQEPSTTLILPASARLTVHPSGGLIVNLQS